MCCGRAVAGYCSAWFQSALTATFSTTVELFGVLAIRCRPSICISLSTHLVQRCRGGSFSKSVLGNVNSTRIHADRRLPCGLGLKIEEQSVSLRVHGFCSGADARIFA